TIFENSGTTIMISEADMTVSLVNSEFEKLIGYSKEEFEGKRKWTELMHQDELEKMMQYHSLRRQDPSVIPKKYETRAYHKNGDIKNLYITVEMIPGTDKSIISIIDVTRQKQTEEELLNEKNFTSNLVQFSPAFYIAIDKDRKILMVNDPLMDATGYSLDDLIDKDFVTALVPDDHKEQVSRLFNILIAAKIATANESVIRTADGRIIPVEWHRRIVFKPDGEIDYYINLGIDISERKEAESALIESEKKYRILAETAFAGIILLDENEVITYANPAFCDMAGSNFKEIANRKLSDVITIEDHENSIAYHKDETDSKNQYFESTLFRNDGSFLNVLISATPLLSAEDNFQGTLAVIVDITQMKKMEEEIAFSRNMSAIGELSRKIAHEIGNPLTSILNSANLLKRKVELEGSNERLMEIILKETKRLDSIILDFLKFSRTKKPVLKPCNIVTCINDQLLLLKNNDQFLSKKIDLKFTHWDTIPDIPLDIDLMKNVLWNLLINSIQAIDSEGIIHIEVFGEEKRGEFLNIAISDTGNGIDKKDMKKIFEPYFTTKSRGSGIGLSIVKKVVTDHTGFIEVSSKSGKGTSFIIKLPTYKRE
ncbi:MAG: PAS domain S-box protein, partial [bacterium]|nr:PAS domain S-box protein [bacterium]